MAEIASLQQDHSTNEEKTAMSNDGRPRLAVGHVNLEVEDVGDATMTKIPEHDYGPVEGSPCYCDLLPLPWPKAGGAVGPGR